MALFCLQSVTTLYPLNQALSTDVSILDNETSTSPDFNLNVNTYDLIARGDADQLSLEIEKER